MNLYEITTGVTGMSYERCYVWAPDETTATDMFLDKYASEDSSDYRKTLASIKFLFSSDAEPFVTVLDTEGWES